MIAKVIAKGQRVDGADIKELAGGHSVDGAGITAMLCTDAIRENLTAIVRMG